MTSLTVPGIPIPIAKDGGDKCANFSYFEELLSTSGCAIDDVTVHSYGLINSKNASETQCSVENFLSPWVWESAVADKLAGWKIRQEVACPASKIVLGETATAGDGGCAGLSNTFSAGFFWVDTLGTMAHLGYWQVYRQDLIGWSGIGAPSSYALIGDPGQVGGSSEATLLPNPDYFSTRLWIRLMGSTVLSAQHTRGSGSGISNVSDSRGGGSRGGGSDGGVRVFAHCTPKNRGYGIGSVTLAYINPTAASVQINSNASAGTPLALSPRVEYVLTSAASSGLPRDDRMRARTVQLNGADKVLHGSDPMDGKQVETEPALTVPPYSYGFVVLPAANHQLCT